MGRVDMAGEWQGRLMEEWGSGRAIGEGRMGNSGEGEEWGGKGGYGLQGGEGGSGREGVRVWESWREQGRVREWWGEGQREGKGAGEVTCRWHNTPYSHPLP